ncbi:hypothetical protein CSKR_100201 [Clonorchis sinensis]|uniref:Uncharacterized protein n=1 Tax=Clonorchis sinensis TaxID=79923 RepID=A0A419PPN2_CLOSI|nr:hypothetical protein CSKR_100201 [Clonorchis sinensis]
MIVFMETISSVFPKIQLRMNLSPKPLLACKEYLVNLSTNSFLCYRQTFVCLSVSICFLPTWIEISELHSFANKFAFARDSPGTQLNLWFVMSPGNSTRSPHVSVATIFEIS